MTVISNNDIARSIYLFLKDEKENNKEGFSKVVKFLARKRLLSKSKNILARLQNIINAGEGIAQVKISSAKKIKEENKKDISKFLKQRYNAKEIIFNEVLDEKLLGGFKIEVRDEIIDLTIKNKLEKLQEYLTRPA
jgi:F-type H+-transporting ATPase subunit delta